MWDFIDKAYVISLESKTTRQQLAQTNINNAGLANKTELFLAKKHAISGAHGCWESHVAVIDLAKKQGHSVVLVLEDDFQFTSDWKTYLPFVKHFVQNTPTENWDFLLLGMFPIRTFKKHSNGDPIMPHITRVECGFQTHAYIVNQTIIKKEGILPKTFVPQNQQEIDGRLFCANVTRSEMYRYGTFKKHTQWMDSNIYPTYKVFALDPMIVLQRYDGTSDAGQMSRFVTKLVSNQRFMRGIQKVTNTIDASTFIGLAIILPTLIIIVISCIIVGIVVHKKHTYKLSHLL